MPNLSPIPQALLDACRVGGGRTARKLRKGALFYEGTKKLQKIMNNAFMSQGLLSRVVVLHQAVRKINLFNGIETISILIIQQRSKCFKI